MSTSYRRVIDAHMIADIVDLDALSWIAIRIFSL